MDHCGASGPRAELTHAEIHLHPLEAERAATAHDVLGEDRAFLRRHGIPEAPLDQQMPSMSRIIGNLYCPAIPDRLLADGDELGLGDGRRFGVGWAPGHA